MKKKSVVEETFDLIDKFYSGKLSKKATNQIKAALNSPKDDFWHDFMEPNIVLDNRGYPVTLKDYFSDTDRAVSHEMADRMGYICLSDRAKLRGRSQEPLLSHLSKFDLRTLRIKDPRDGVSLFTNHLRFGVTDDEGCWDAPSERVMIGPFTIFTIEHDAPSDWPTEDRIELLETQISWFRKPGDGENSRAIHRMIEWGRQFSDFRGVVANYSGNKSVHIHFIFYTGHILQHDPGLIDKLRPAYSAAFGRLSDAFSELLPAAVKPDPALRQPEQFRKLPNGTFVVPKDKEHLFGVPAGARIKQMTLYELLLSKAPAGADKLFLDPVEIDRLSSRAETSGATKTRRISSLHHGWASPEEQVYCFNKLSAMIDAHSVDGFPKLASLDFEPQLIAHLQANERDRNPNVVIYENSARTHAAGGQKPTKHIDIGLPLAHHVAKWQREWRRQNPGAHSAHLDDPRLVTLIEPAQPDQSLTQQQARDEFQRQMSEWIDAKPILLVRGPEGVGKTTHAMRRLPGIVNRLIMADQEHIADNLDHEIGRTVYRRPSIVATSSYEQADEKRDQFNQACTARGFIGILFESFNRIYDRALAQIFGEDGATQKIRKSDAARSRCSSIIAAIRKLQPEVWERMEQLHAEMLKPWTASPADTHVVLFTVHDVAHQWAEDGLSRLFSHRDFFKTPQEDYWKLRDDTELRVAIHDELDWSHFVHLQPHQDVLWCQQMFDRDPVWSSPYPDLAEAFQSWQSEVGSVPGKVEFEIAFDIRRKGFDAKVNVGVGPVERYGVYENGEPWPMYQEAHQHRYCYVKRSWWRCLAQKTLLLTTEALPMALFQQSISEDDDAIIFDGSCLSAATGKIEVYRLNTVQSKKNEKTIKTMRDHLDRPELRVIANGTASVPNTITYVSAKGRNDLADEDLLQIANFAAPLGEYDVLQVINRVYGINNAIRLRHVDLVNQAAGRNQGYRDTGRSYRHWLVISTALWDFILPELLLWSRYAIATIEDAETRRDRSNNRKKADVARWAKAEQEDSIPWTEDFHCETETDDERYDRWAMELDPGYDEAA